MRGPRAGRDALDGRLLALSRSRPTVFVLRALGLGDLLTAVPALRALRAAYPAAEIVLGAPAAYAPLVALTGAVDRVCATSGLDDRPRLESGMAVAVNLHGKGPRSTRLLQSLRPARLLAFASPECQNTGPQWRADEHEVARWCRLVAETLQVPADPGDLRLSTPAGAPAVSAAVVIHPGAAHAARRWPADRFAAVAAWARNRDLPVVVTGTAEEYALARSVAGSAGLSSEAILAGRLGLTELAALVGSARLVVSGDTGVAHLATAYGIASVTLFGPTPPQLWGPPADPRHVVLWNGLRRPVRADGRPRIADDRSRFGDPGSRGPAGGEHDLHHPPPLTPRGQESPLERSRIAPRAVKNHPSRGHKSSAERADMSTSTEMAM
jgi:ADP-heptose:LPS heptosyltransferase